MPKQTVGLRGIACIMNSNYVCLNINYDDDVKNTKIDHDSIQMNGSKVLVNFWDS